MSNFTVKCSVVEPKLFVSAPATALELPVITDFMLKSKFFMLLMKENRPNSHAIQYEF
jgi:hypothetical protein